MAFDNSSGVDRVQFYVNDVLMATDSSNPYAFYWTKLGFNLYNLKIVVNDKSDNSVTKLVQVWKFF